LEILSGGDRRHDHRYWLVDGDWPADEKGRKDFAGVMATMSHTW
jgi:hypothetical protein